MYTSDDESVRDRLLSGALTCLREKGYAETTARDITAASGTNLRSIGYHFESTKGLLLTAISLNFRRWLEPLIEAAADADSPPAERLAIGMRSFSDALPQNAPTLRAWVEAVVLGGHDPELRRILAEHQTEFRDALARTLSDAGYDRTPERAAAIIAICDGLIIRFLLHGEASAPEDVTLAAATVMEALVEARPG